jgi:hypothetical protein
MIIQHVIKGISNLSSAEANALLSNGITCRWWQRTNPLPRQEVPLRLTERNLDWHQNMYDQPDPLEGGERFCLHTPFISTTAGTVERDTALQTNLLTSAWEIALRFATDFWKTDGYLFYCYLLIIGKRAVGHEAFAEELRELSVYTAYSPYQPEGEMLAKVIIPPAQIEKAEFWTRQAAFAASRNGTLPKATQTLPNPLFLPPSEYSNVRNLLL